MLSLPPGCIVMMLIIRDRHETPVVTSSGSASPQPNATAASTAQDQRRAGPAAEAHRRAEDDDRAIRYGGRSRRSRSPLARR